MLKGNDPDLSTPKELMRPKRFTLLGVFLINVLVATQSVCSGPFFPFHLKQVLFDELDDRCSVKCIKDRRVSGTTSLQFQCRGVDAPDPGTAFSMCKQLGIHLENDCRHGI